MAALLLLSACAGGSTESGGSREVEAAAAPEEEASESPSAEASPGTPEEADASEEAEDPTPLEPVPGRGRKNDFSYEMHWGMLGELTPAADEPDLELAVDGKITFTDDDPDTEEGIHIISAQLFELDDSVDHPPWREAFRNTGGTFFQWISWESTTTTDWDGMAFRLHWAEGTDPTIRIETSVWDGELEVSELRNHSEVLSVGDDGQSLEMGEFFQLTYKVYDLAVTWGFLDESEVSGATDWNGSITLEGGGIHLFGTNSFEAEDEVIQDGDLSPTLSWQSTTTTGSDFQQAADAMSLNLVAPTEVSRPELRISVGGIEESFSLPARPADWVEVIEVSDGGTFRGHVHWCWFKEPSGRVAAVGR